MLRPAAPLVLALGLSAAGCGRPDPPPSLGFTGKCALAVRDESPAFVQRLLTPDELKTHVALELSQGTLVSMHVELPDGRSATLGDQEPDDPLLVGDARPNVPLDPETDVDVPVELSRSGAQTPWDLPVRVRFHGRTADAVVGRMRVTGDCVPATPPP